MRSTATVPRSRGTYAVPAATAGAARTLSSNGPRRRRRRPSSGSRTASELSSGTSSARPSGPASAAMTRPAYSPRSDIGRVISHTGVPSRVSARRVYSARTYTRSSTTTDRGEVLLAPVQRRSPVPGSNATTPAPVGTTTRLSSGPTDIGPVALRGSVAVHRSVPSARSSARSSPSTAVTSRSSTSTGSASVVPMSVGRAVDHRFSPVRVSTAVASLSTENTVSPSTSGAAWSAEPPVHTGSAREGTVSRVAPVFRPS